VSVLSILTRTGPAFAALLVGVVAVAAEPDPSSRFALNGNGSLSRDAKTFSGGTLSLRGYLQSNEARSTAAIVQDGGRFTIMAKAIVLASVCYNDTIFRDDFDGDGG
jgi:hypothetical protein